MTIQHISIFSLETVKLMIQCSKGSKSSTEDKDKVYDFNQNQTDDTTTKKEQTYLLSEDKFSTINYS